MYRLCANTMPLHGMDSMMEFLCPQGVLGSFHRDDCDQSWVFLSTNLRVISIRKKSKSFSIVLGLFTSQTYSLPSLSSLPSLPLPPVSFILSSGQFLDHAKYGGTPPCPRPARIPVPYVDPSSRLQLYCHPGGVTSMSLPSSPLALAWQSPPACPPKDRHPFTSH